MCAVKRITSYFIFIFYFYFFIIIYYYYAYWIHGIFNNNLRYNITSSACLALALLARFNTIYW